LKPHSWFLLIFSRQISYGQDQVPGRSFPNERSVIPAKAGIQEFLKAFLDSGFRRNDRQTPSWHLIWTSLEQFRICFIWTEQGPERVEITDYH
jgi:hypothetical protein